LSDDEKALRQELAALQHELRRVMDGCERELRQRNRALQSPANKA
jgi:hypothetical protein